MFLDITLAIANVPPLAVDIPQLIVHHKHQYSNYLRYMFYSHDRIKSKGITIIRLESMSDNPYHRCRDKNEHRQARRIVALF